MALKGRPKSYFCEDSFELSVGGLPSSLNEYMAIGQKGLDDRKTRIDKSDPDSIIELEESQYLLYNSVFILAYFYFESSMDRIIRETYKKIGKSHYAKYISSQLDRFKEDSKYLGLSFDFGCTEWESIRKYCLIRNCTVHRYGRLDTEEDSELYPFAEYKGILNNEELTLNQKFCEEAMDVMDRFLYNFYLSFQTAVSS